jgi:hypothetical protein
VLVIILRFSMLGDVMQLAVPPERVRLLAVHGVVPYGDMGGPRTS